jgi:putative RNA 2'-phosphotransferase
MSDVQISKFLSYVLRHEPEAIGLEVDRAGWAAVDELVECAQGDGRQLDRETIERVVAESDKERFELSEDGSRIRANYGHSIEVDLGLEAEAPPEWLCHGTARKSLDSIRRQGLRPQGRQWVHLNEDDPDGRRQAREVGARHGEPVLVRVETAAVDRAFYRSTDDIWLVAAVPSEAITIERENS